MRRSDRITRRIALGFAGAVFACAAVADTSAPPSAPKRVVSMNLCTDQLAMMLAAPGQLVSVSDVASDPQVSAMVDEARAYPQNFGRAEEIYLMKPDLVLVGEYSRTQAAEMLERLGVEVLRLPFARSMEDVSKGMLILGRALGREAEAEAMVADFETRLARQRAEVRSNPRAALYSANGYTTGRLSLSGQILLAAGFSNVADEAGIPVGGNLPMERLVMAQPDLLITSAPYPGASRSEDVLRHPAVEAMRAAQASKLISSNDWVCGTPHVLRAIEALAAERRALEENEARP